MQRLQLALDVPDLDAAVDFYERLFATAPHKRRPGYANFAIAEPPLKLVLFENAAAPVTALNHLGVEVGTTDDVVATTRRLDDAGLTTRVADDVTCCHATQDKVYATAPDGTEWEYYTITDDAPDSLADTDDTPACDTTACC